MMLNGVIFSEFNCNHHRRTCNSKRRKTKRRQH